MESLVESEEQSRVSQLTLEHIDPRNGVLVSGLENDLNEVFADFSYNSRKTNRFVPYRVCDHPAPVTFGDIGEFLISGEWLVCEFGGPEWWEESNKVGNATTKGGQVGGSKTSPRKTEANRANFRKGNQVSHSKKDELGRSITAVKASEATWSNPENRVRAAERGRLSDMKAMGAKQPREVRQQNGRRMGLSHCKEVEVTLLSTGESFTFTSAKEAALSFGVPLCSFNRSARNNKPYKCFQARYTDQTQN